MLANTSPTAFRESCSLSTPLCCACREVRLCAFKALVVLHALQDHGRVLWLDANFEVRCVAPTDLSIYYLPIHPSLYLSG